MKTLKTESGPTRICSLNRSGTRTTKRFSPLLPVSCLVDLSGNYPPKCCPGAGLDTDGTPNGGAATL